MSVVAALGSLLEIRGFLNLTVIAMLAAPAALESQPAPRLPALELHALITGLELDSSVGETGTGFGLRAVLNLSELAALEAECAYFPENPAGNYGQTLVLAGVKAGVRSGKFGFRAMLRPGLLHFGGSAFRRYNGSGLTRAALDLALALEYDLFSAGLVRLDVGGTTVFFGDVTVRRPTLDPEVRPGTTWNRHVTLAIGLRL